MLKEHNGKRIRFNSTVSRAHKSRVERSVQRPAWISKARTAQCRDHRSRFHKAPRKVRSCRKSAHRRPISSLLTYDARDAGPPLHENPFSWEITRDCTNRISFIPTTLETIRSPLLASGKRSSPESNPLQKWSTARIKKSSCTLTARLYSGRNVLLRALHSYAARCNSAVTARTIFGKTSQWFFNVSHFHIYFVRPR